MLIDGRWLAASAACGRRVLIGGAGEPAAPAWASVTRVPGTIGTGSPSASSRSRTDRTGAGGRIVIVVVVRANAPRTSSMAR